MVKDFDSGRSSPKAARPPSPPERTCIMLTVTKPLSLAAPRPSRVAWDIVVAVDRESRLVAHYRVTCRDRETGVLIAESVSSPAPDGGPPRITIGDVVELLGECRTSSVVIEIDACRIADPCPDFA
jgi:hypothetical protein